MESPTLAQTIDRLSAAVGELRESTAEDHQRLAGNVATIVLLMKEQLRQQQMMSDAQRRELLHLRGAVNDLTRREPSRTIVRDTITVESTGPSRGDEISVVNIRLPWRPGRLYPVPNRIIRWAVGCVLSAIGGGGLVHLLHRLGAL